MKQESPTARLGISALWGREEVKPTFLTAVPEPSPDLRLVPTSRVVLPLFRGPPPDETVDDHDPDLWPPDDVA